jgi:hypothetical protein
MASIPRLKMSMDELSGFKFKYHMPANSPIVQVNPDNSIMEASSKDLPSNRNKPPFFDKLGSAAQLRGSQQLPPLSMKKNLRQKGRMASQVHIERNITSIRDLSLVETTPMKQELTVVSERHKQNKKIYTLNDYPRPNMSTENIT